MAEDKALSRLEKLEAKMEKVKRQIALERRRESEKARKERTHRLIRRGGLVEMVLGENVDAGLLVGLLLAKKSMFENDSALSSEASEMKLRGDRLIAEREAAQKGGKKKDAEHGGTDESGRGGTSAGTSASGAGGARQDAQDAADGDARLH